MKTIIKFSEPIKTKHYICETCKNEYTDIYAARHCERKHLQENCIHTKFKYSCDIDYDSTLITIYKHCAECGKLISEIDIDSDDFSEEMLKQLMDKNENA